MSSPTRIEIGFSQPIELPWLEHTAFLVASGRDPEQIRSSLDDLLIHKIAIASHASRNSRSKRVSILLRTWVLLPPSLQAFREAALELIRHLPSSQHLPLHYGMTLVAYPFFASVAENIGRLLRLQEDLTISQLQRRVSEALGQRDTVKEATRRVVRSLVDWGCLQQEQKSGTYAARAPLRIQEPELTSWLLEALLIARKQTSLPIDQIESSPVLFPFALPPIRDAVSHLNKRLTLTRHGLDQEILHRTP